VVEFLTLALLLELRLQIVLGLVAFTHNDTAVQCFCILSNYFFRFTSGLVGLPKSELCVNCWIG